MTAIHYGNGTSTDYAYDSKTLRLTNLRTTNDRRQMTIQDLSYTFDPAGNVSSITDASGAGTNTQTFEYDNLNRLTKATGAGYGTINYQYDSIGNMLQKGSMSMNYGEEGAGPHAVTSYTLNANRYTLSYDPNGNMLTKKYEGGKKTFEYDIENRLAASTSYSASANRNAVTPTIDGLVTSAEEWGDSIISATDINEPAITDSWDVKAVYMKRVTGKGFGLDGLYFRVDTWGAPTLSGGPGAGGAETFLQFYLDIVGNSFLSRLLSTY